MPFGYRDNIRGRLHPQANKFTNIPDILSTNEKSNNNDYNDKSNNSNKNGYKTNNDNNKCSKSTHSVEFKADKIVDLGKMSLFYNNSVCILKLRKNSN